MQIQQYWLADVYKRSPDSSNISTNGGLEGSILSKAVISRVKTLYESGLKGWTWCIAVVLRLKALHEWRFEEMDSLWRAFL